MHLEWVDADRRCRYLGTMVGAVRPTGYPTENVLLIPMTEKQTRQLVCIQEQLAEQLSAIGFADQTTTFVSRREPNWFGGDGILCSRYDVMVVTRKTSWQD